MDEYKITDGMESERAMKKSIAGHQRSVQGIGGDYVWDVYGGFAIEVVMVR